jgi:hypothetical protein
MKKQNPVVSSLPESAYVARSSSCCHYGLYFARPTGRIEMLNNIQPVACVEAAQKVCETDLMPAKWSGTQGLPRIGETVQIGRPFKCPGVVVAYFVEHDWLGVELVPQKFPAQVSRENHPHALMFGIDITRDVAAMRDDKIRVALDATESFVSGFEDDDSQEAGSIAQLLKQIRDAQGAL